MFYVFIFLCVSSAECVCKGSLFQLLTPIVFYFIKKEIYYILTMMIIIFYGCSEKKITNSDIDYSHLIDW